MNWKQEAVERLRLYSGMKQAVKNLPLELKRLEQEATNLGAGNSERVKNSSTVHSRENWLMNNIIQRQELLRAYNNAVQWLSVTDGALDTLPEEDLRILSRMYIEPVSCAAAELCAELGVEQSSVYRRRDKALYQFTVALYGIAS